MNDKILQLIELNKFDEALKSITEEISINPNTPILYYLKSICEYSLSLHEESKVSIQEAISLDPENSIYQFHLSEIHLSEGNIEKSYIHLDSVDPQDSEEMLEYYKQSSRIGIYSEKFEEAVSNSSLGLKIDPSDIELKNLNFFAIQLSGTRTISEEELKDLLTIEPDNPFSKANYSLKNIIDGNYDHAEEITVDSLSQYPNNHILHIALKFISYSKLILGRPFLKYLLFLSKNKERIKSFSNFSSRISIILFAFIFNNGNLLFGLIIGFLIGRLLTSLPIYTLISLYELQFFKVKHKHLIFPRSAQISSLLTGLISLIGIILLLSFLQGENIYSFVPLLLVLWLSSWPFKISKATQSQYIFVSILLFCIPSVLTVVNLFLLNEQILYLFTFLILIASAFWDQKVTISK